MLTQQCEALNHLHMKHLFFIILLIVAVGCSKNGSDEEAEKLSRRVHIDSIHATDDVWVCQGSGATRFHSNDTCAGLQQCTKKIIIMTRGEAEAKGRTWCHKCYRDE